MPRRVKYRLPASPAARRDFIGWLIAGLVVLSLVWLWWERGKSESTESQPPSPPVSAPQTSPPVRMTITTNGNALTARLTPQTSAPPAILIASNPVVPQSAATNIPSFTPRPVQNVPEAQLALARLGFSPGSLDGISGSQTRAALRAFQQREGLPLTSELDARTRERLRLFAPPHTNYIVSIGDLARLRPVSDTWLGKSQQDRLDYETILELAAETGRAHPDYIRQINPYINWTNVAPGTVITIPQVDIPAIERRAAFARIFLSGRQLQVFDLQTNLLAHFPCSIAARVEKRPLGALYVQSVIENPNYTFNPEIFPESAEGRRLGHKLVLPTGPNNPVGVAWIGLDRPGYGIHGTPSPEAVGRTESHGCFRLANWNAEHLRRMAWIGMPVYVEP